MLNQADELDRRLKLFVFPPDLMGLFPAVGYKLHIMSLSGSHVRFDWDTSPVRGDEGPAQRIREKEEDRGEMGAIEARFFPLMQCFDSLGRLPHSTRELAEIADTISPRPPNRIPWQVYPNDRVEEIADVLERIRAHHELAHTDKESGS